MAEAAPLGGENVEKKPLHVGYEIVVADLETGAVRRYVKPYGPPAPALTDTAAFACSP